VSRWAQHAALTCIMLRSFDSPLHYAAREGCVDVVHMLLERGARVNEEGYKSDSSRPAT
jgi:ankyrin repeat protein